MEEITTVFKLNVSKSGGQCVFYFQLFSFHMQFGADFINWGYLANSSEIGVTTLALAPVLTVIVQSCILMWNLLIGRTRCVFGRYNPPRAHLLTSAFEFV